MPIEIIGHRKTPAKISNIVLDATLRVSHEYVNEISDYVIEDGVTISDHVRQLPESVTINGHFTNTPIRILDGQIGSQIATSNSERIQIAHDELLKLAGYSLPKQPGEAPQKTGTPAIIDIVTGLRVYTNMVITRYFVPETVANKGQLNFIITAKPLNKVSTEFTVINNSSELNGKAPLVKNQSQKTVNSGTNTPKEVDQSYADKIFSYLKNKASGQ